uniref:Serine protease 23 n=1 Tax=Sinocyclocheilus rhinocerous TaxID=307959 RepID=A0A673LTB3_9TELE
MFQKAFALLIYYGAFPLHGTARLGTVHFWGFFHWVQYLVLFFSTTSVGVPSEPYRYQNERPPPHFLQPAQLEVTSSCGLECHKRDPQPSYWDLRQFLSYETLHSKGQLTETSGSKRQIFGHDSCFSIVDQYFLLNYPVSTAVKLPTGCSCTLVGDRHVLTTAHCIHDGKNGQKDMLGRNSTNTRPDKMRFQWIRVKRTHVPKGWIKGTANDIGMDYDYALLELKKAHKWRHMKLGISPTAKQLPGKRVQFSGFDNNRPGQLVYRFCEAGDESYDPLYQHCDAQPGASGSGVYARMWNRRRQRWERKVIGIISENQWVDLSGTPQEFNVGVRITPLKFAQICYWIKGNYVDCREG